MSPVFRKLALIHSLRWAFFFYLLLITLPDPSYSRRHDTPTQYFSMRKHISWFLFVFCQGCSNAPSYLDLLNVAGPFAEDKRNQIMCGYVNVLLPRCLDMLVLRYTELLYFKHMFSCHLNTPFRRLPQNSGTLSPGFHNAILGST